MIYICAGMPRSGSTWMFNVVRLLLKHAEAPDLAGGYVGQAEELLAHQTSIIKLHPFDFGLASRADVILTAHRDLRDVAASMKRHYEKDYSAPEMNEWVKSQVKWTQYAAYDMHYELLLVDRLAEVKKIAGTLRLAPTVLARLPYEAILNEIEGQKFTKKFSEASAYDAVNLLHEGHITDGRHGSWTGVLPEKDVAAIEREFRGWLTTRNYLDSPAATAVAS
jgi:hypothetical protein